MQQGMGEFMSNNGNSNTEQSILLVSDDAALCAAARREFESRIVGLRVAAVSNVDAARRILKDEAPAVIVFELEETSAAADAGGTQGAIRADRQRRCGLCGARRGALPSGNAGRHPAAIAPDRGRRGREFRTICCEPRRFRRSAAARIEQSADGHPGKRGIAARGNPQKRRRPTSGGRTAARGNHRRAGSAFARDGAPPEPGVGSAPSPEALNLALSVLDYGNSRKFTLIVVSISMGSPFRSVEA